MTRSGSGLLSILGVQSVVLEEDTACILGASLDDLIRVIFFSRLFPNEVSFFFSFFFFFFFLLKKCLFQKFWEAVCQGHASGKRGGGEDPLLSFSFSFSFLFLVLVSLSHTFFFFSLVLLFFVSFVLFFFICFQDMGYFMLGYSSVCTTRELSSSFLNAQKWCLKSPTDTQKMLRKKAKDSLFRFIKSCQVFAHNSVCVALLSSFFFLFLFFSTLSSVLTLLIFLSLSLSLRISF